MPEIVDDRDAAADAAHFHAALDPAKRVEGRLDLVIFDPAMFGATHHCERIADIQFADEVEMKLEAWDLEFGSSRPKPDIEGAHTVVLAQAKAFHRAGCCFDERRNIGIVAVGKQQPVARNEVDEPLEGKLDFGKVAKNIGVIEFD